MLLLHYLLWFYNDAISLHKPRFFHQNCNFYYKNFHIHDLHKSKCRGLVPKRVIKFSCRAGSSITSYITNLEHWTVKISSRKRLNIGLDYIENKGMGENNHSLHSGRDRGIPSSCPSFATSPTRQASTWIANHGHSDGIPLSLLECNDIFY